MNFAQAHADHLDPDNYYNDPDVPELYDWQEDHCSKLVYAIQTFGYAKDGSDTGTGKTLIALETARRLDLVPFVIAPKSVIPAWKRWYKEFFPHVEEPFVFNYEKLRTGNTPYVKKVGKRFQWQVKHHCLLIFDEDHKCKGNKSLNSALLTGAAYDGRHTLLLGATSCTDPTEMKALGFALGLHKGSDWWNWCLKNGCVRGHFGGLDFVGGRLHLKSLHDQIYSKKGSRLRTKEIPDFPETLITAEGYEVGFPEHIDVVYKELADLAQQASGDADPDNPLTKQLRLRQEIELMKAPIFADLAANAIEEGGAVAVFVSFRETLEKVVELLKKYRPLVIQGGDTLKERQHAIDSFGIFSRCVVCTISAGGLGISLHDEHGTFPRVSIISPSFSAIELKQALGRVHRAGAKTKSVQRIVFAANTVEEKVCSRVRQKLNNIDLINDDELNPIL